MARLRSAPWSRQLPLVGRPHRSPQELILHAFTGPGFSHGQADALCVSKTRSAVSLGEMSKWDKNYDEHLGFAIGDRGINNGDPRSPHLSDR
jgi:hypothetical protein